MNDNQIANEIENELKKQYDSVTKIGNLFVVCEKNNMFGVVGANDGSLLHRCYGDAAYQLNEHLVLLSDYNMFCIFNADEAKKIQGYYKSVISETPSENFIVENTDGKLGAIDGNGNLILPCEHDEIIEQDNCFRTINFGKIGLYNKKTGELMFGKMFDSAINTSNYYLTLFRGKWGASLFSGKQVVPNIADEIVQEKDGIRVRCENAWGFYDNNGQKILPVKYSLFQLTKLLQKLNIDCGMGEYEHVVFIDSAMITYAKGKCGVRNASGDVVLRCKYDEVVVTEFGYMACLEGKWGCYSKQGSKIVPCEHSKEELEMLLKGKNFSFAQQYV